MSQPLLTEDGLFHCMVTLGKTSIWGLASFRVWRCCSQQLLHWLLMLWRQRWEAGTPEKLSQKGHGKDVSTPNSLVMKLRKKVTAKFHCLWHSQRNPLKPGLMSSLHESPLPQIHHLHCSFCVQFNWPNLGPNPGLKKPSLIVTFWFQRWGEMRISPPILSKLVLSFKSSHVEKAIFLNNCFVWGAGSFLPLQPSPAMGGPCTMSCSREGTTSPILSFCPGAPLVSLQLGHQRWRLFFPSLFHLPWHGGRGSQKFWVDLSAK